MSKRVLLLISGMSLFFLFILFSYLVHKHLFTQLDFNMTVRLQDHISRRFDALFSYFSLLGRFEVMLVVLLGLFLVLRKFLAGIIAFILFIGFHLIEVYGKFFVHHPPPPHFMLRTENLGNFPQFYVSADNSYPSGHSGRTLFLATILIVLIANSKKFSLVTKGVLCGGIGLFVITMLVSRVYLGEHWTSDVIGGSILGMAFGLLTIGFVRTKKK